MEIFTLVTPTILNIVDSFLLSSENTNIPKDTTNDGDTMLYEHFCITFFLISKEDWSAIDDIDKVRYYMIRKRNMCKQTHYIKICEYVDIPSNCNF